METNQYATQLETHAWFDVLGYVGGRWRWIEDWSDESTAYARARHLDSILPYRVKVRKNRGQHR